MVYHLTSVDEAITRLSSTLALEPSGLLSDFDGTLSGIARIPTEATLAPGAKAALAELRQRLALVGIVTGRAISDVRALIDLSDLLYVGNHGLEWAEGDIHEMHDAGLEAEFEVTAAFAEIERQLANLVSTQGMFFEHKRLSGSIHYRVADDRDGIDMHLERIAREVATAHHLRISMGKMTVELRPLAVVNKGTAIREQAEWHRLRGVVFLGDDVTDVDGFRALNTMREIGEYDTCAVGVLTADTAPEVIDSSDILLGGVSEVVDVLTGLSHNLDELGVRTPRKEAR